MLTRRHMEVATGLSLAAIGAITAYGSIENGTGWTDFGPAAGYFPFRIGLLIVALGLAIAVKYGLRGRGKAVSAAAPEIAGAAAHDPSAELDEGFFGPGSFRRIASVFVPTAVCAALIPWLGLYISSAVFLVFSMMTLGKVAIGKAALIAASTMGVTFVLFEFWFQVPLAKGLIMPLLGIY